jgi:hypothetical protein
MANSHPNDSQRFSELVGEARSAKNTKGSDLDRLRVGLLRERAAGASLRTMVEVLSKMDVNVSDETLRRWFRKQVEDGPSSPKPAAAKSGLGTRATRSRFASNTTRPASGLGPRIAREDI